MTRLDIITSAADEFSREVAKLLAVGSFSPIWKDKFGWRHPCEMKDVVLFWLTKLAGIASTIHASVLIAKQGYWFQVAILARSVTEAHLSIAYTLPKPDMQSGDWPSAKQNEAIREHYKETWADPQKPFDDQRQRPNIRNISAAIGHMQDGNSPLTQHDASQGAMQNMRFLSDYTHMAYPQIMELFSGRAGFLLSGNQGEKSLFGEMELGRLVVGSFIYAEVVCEFLRKIYSGCVEKAAAEKAEMKKAAVIQEKLQLITTLRDELEAAGTELETVFPSSDEEVRKVLRAFKQGKPL
jgi:hypothetical protein